MQTFGGKNVLNLHLDVGKNLKDFDVPRLLHFSVVLPPQDDIVKSKGLELCTLCLD